MTSLLTLYQFRIKPDDNEVGDDVTLCTADIPIRPNNSFKDELYCWEKFFFSGNAKVLFR